MLKIEPLPWWINALCWLTGTAIGTVVFLWTASIYAGSIIGKSLMSVHGVIVKDGLDAITKEQSLTIDELIRNNSLIDANTFLSTLNNFYATTVQVLIGIFFIFGILSFIAIRNHSSREIELQSKINTKEAVQNYIDSIRFRDLVGSEVNSNFQIELESILESYSDATDLNDRVQTIESELTSLKRAIAAKADPEGD